MFFFKPLFMGDVAPRVNKERKVESVIWCGFCGVDSIFFNGGCSSSLV